MENPAVNKYSWGAADKYGLYLRYEKKFPFEDEIDVDDSAYYRPGDKRIKPNAHQLVKRFLRQVRESRGYDVDCVPPPSLGSPFVPIPLDFFKVKHKNYYDEHVVKVTQFAVQKISAETKCNYELVDIEKVVVTTSLLKLLTFTAKKVVADDDADADASVQTFQAMVWDSPANMKFVEWRFKPDPTASTSSA